MTWPPAQLWRYFADGPVRLAPLVHQQSVLFVSDDGYLYCLSAQDGTLQWRFRGGPQDRWLIGNDRFISMWPARGAPVVYDDTVYFAAGIWPFMGVFVHAVDVRTGQAVWTNSGSGASYTVQQHSSPAFAGVAPQGYLAANQQMLLVSGGMTVPAAFDRETGQLIYFRPGDRQLGKDQGGFPVMLGPDWYANRGGLHQLSDGDPRLRVPADVLTPHGLLGVSGKQLVGLDTKIQRRLKTTTDAKGKEKKTVTYGVAARTRARLPLEQAELHLHAGEQVVLSDQGSHLLLVAEPAEQDGDCQVLWEGAVSSPIWRAIVADQRLVVVSQDGTITCFGATAQQPPGGPLVHKLQSQATTDPQRGARELADRLLRVTTARDGYALVDSPVGLAVARALAATTRFHLLVLEPNTELRQRWKEQLAADQLLGTRIDLLPGDLSSAELAPYFAELVVAHRWPTAGQTAIVQRAQSVLRPYGGVAVLQCEPAERNALEQLCRQQQLTPQHAGDEPWVVLSRPGPLPGAGSWTAQSGDAGNTLVSKEQNVQTPLGMLWFGGPSNRDVLPRHGHGPTPQVIGGRLFIEGRDMLRAVDVYTGRLLWQHEFKDVGIYYDNTDHHPGAGAIGGNFVSTVDSVYLVWGRRCLRLDPATGATLAEFELPPDSTSDKPYWGYLAVSGEVLIAGSSPMLPLTRYPGEPKAEKEADRDVPLYSQFGEGSRRLVVLDRFTGQVQWTRDAQFNFRHNAITVGDGKLFCLDRMTDQRLAFYRRRGTLPVSEFCLHALDLRDGTPVWQSTQDVFGTWLAYNASSQLLLEAGSKNRDRATDETGQGMAVYDALTGQRLWRSDVAYGGPPLVFPDRIVTQGTAISWRHGTPLTRLHPLTDESLPWEFTRNYGCNTAIGCPNLLTFRSAAAGYFDLRNDGGTGNLGGFRSSCTANLIAADGVLNAPDYTRTCTCSYQNQCSLALIHMPDVEMWTFNRIDAGTQRVKRVGINFGAPGDRRDEQGTLWLDYPSVGGPSPNVTVQVAGDDVQYQRAHMPARAVSDPGWVFASGMQHAKSIRIRLSGSGQTDPDPREYRVALYMALRDPAADRAPTGSLNNNLKGRKLRVQGIPHDLLPPDLTPRQLERGFVRQLIGVPVGEFLEIELADDVQPALTHLIICGLEVHIQ